MWLSNLNEEHITHNADEYNLSEWKQIALKIEVDKFSNEFFEKFQHELFGTYHTHGFRRSTAISRWALNEHAHTEFLQKYHELIGAKMWKTNGKLDRYGAPAFIHRDGTEIWYKDGVMHREPGPAITYYNGKYYYYHNGNLVNNNKIRTLDCLRVGERWDREIYIGKK